MIIFSCSIAIRLCVVGYWSYLRFVCESERFKAVVWYVSIPPSIETFFNSSSRYLFLLLVAPPSLIDTLAQLLTWRSLLWLPMTWRWRYLRQSNFLSTKSLAWSLALHLFCFSQEKPLRRKEINTHTHTHTHTRKHAISFRQTNHVLVMTQNSW